MILFKRLSVIITIIFVSFSIDAIPVLCDIDSLIVVTERDVVVNSDIISVTTMKKISPAEYVTDPVILYAGLWLTLGLNVPVRDPKLSFFEETGENAFSERVLLEPFSNVGFDTIFSPLKSSDGSKIRDKDGDYIYFPNGNFFAKNLIEPAMFTYFALYLRSKNYHPALIIGELFTLSLIYEFTVRPFFMNASFEQLIKNPTVGILAGLILDEISSYLLTTPYMALHVVAYLLNPFKMLPTKRVYPMLFFEPYKKAVYFEVSINP